MPLHASPALLELLTRLGLATPAEVQSVAARVRRLTRSLPNFDQAWVDSLAQARILTAYQAGEINAGRAEALVVGPYLLERPLDNLGYATVYRARLRVAHPSPAVKVMPSGTSGWRKALGKLGLAGRAPSPKVRLAIVSDAGRSYDELKAPLSELVQRGRTLNSPHVAAIHAYGIEATRLWAAISLRDDMTAAERLARHGRFEPVAVLEIARQMIAGIDALERAGIVHGDISLRNVLLGSDGRVQLAFAGLRGLLRPNETTVESESLPPEVADYLSAERAAGSAPSMKGDLCAVGLVWWHLLAGRAPHSAATLAAKLEAAHSERVADVTHLAANVPATLVAAVRACVEREPAMRPAAAADLAKQLGPSPRGAQGELARLLRQPSARHLTWGQTAPHKRWSRSFTRIGAIVAGCVLMVVAGTWPQWQPSVTRKLVEEAAPQISVTVPVTLPAAPVASKTVLPAQPPVVAPPVGPWPGSIWENDEIVVTAGEPIAVDHYKLKQPTTIRSKLGQRAVVIVPPTGWRLEGEGVRFENIDFVADEKNVRDALIRLDVRRVEFVGCSWQHQPAAAGPAIAWNPPTRGNRDDESLLRGELHVADCLVQSVSAAVAYDGRGSALLEFANVLHIGPGPLVQLEMAPERGQLIELTASHVTLRDAHGLLVIGCEEIPPEHGQFIIVTDDCALIPATGSGLIMFSGVEQPAALLHAIDWRGQGTVIAQHAALCVWRDGEGTLRGAEDDKLRVAGLVRSQIDFSGDKAGGPTASRVVRWQAPRQSPEPPGIRDTKPLPVGVLR